MITMQQRGMTTIGFLLVLAVLGLIAFGVIQLVPVYLENMKIVQLLNQTKEQLDGQSPSVKDIRDALYKRAEIEDLRDIDTKKDFVVKPVSGGYTVSINYERRKPYVANISLLAEFEHSVEINN
jgi:Domain of unknown function (DUF4845)